MNPSLYFHTLRHLDAEQVRYQVLHRLRALGPGRTPVRPPRPLPVQRAWGPAVLRCRGRIDPAVLDGRFTFWSASRRLDLRSPWQAPDLGRSWSYPVHYFDYAPALAAAARAAGDAGSRDALCRLLSLWIEVHPPGRGIAWEAYPTALRIVNWLDVLHTLGEWSDAAWREEVLSSLYTQAAWLERHLERHLMGTHLLKDAKALTLVGQVFADDAAARWRRIGVAILRRELGRQIHPDGGHVEPSVLYHGIALEDGLDLLNFRVPEPALRAELERVVARMLDFLAAVRPPGGGYPLLGDAARDAEPSPEALVECARRLGLQVPGARDGLCWLPDSGLVAWRDARQYLLADVGPVGPPHLAGHGHCDSLSFEWHVDRLPILVDSGTRTYEPGLARLESRSTRAHNTLEIDGREQHEMWAAFRVARRSAVHARLEEGNRVRAELVPWHDTRLRVERSFDPRPGGYCVQDRVAGPGTHAVVSRLHLHPDCVARLEGRTVHVTRGAVRVRIELKTEARIELLDASRSGSQCCESFGAAVPNPELRISAQGPLPWECEIDLVVGE